jgi:hypothetical protein
MPLAVRVRREENFIRGAIVADRAQLIRNKHVRTLHRELQIADRSVNASSLLASIDDLQIVIRGCFLRESLH